MGKPAEIEKAESVAKQAYEIYRGMKVGEPNIPHWDDLPRDMRGLVEWVAVFATLKRDNETR